MRRHDRELSDPAIIQEIFEKADIVRIGFSIDNQAHIVPVNYGYRDHKLYIHSAGRGQKIQWIKQNNDICFEIEMPYEIITGEQACDWTTKYRSIIGRGMISVITDVERKKEGLDIIMNAHGSPGVHTYDEAALSRMLIIEIDIKSFTAKQSGDW